MATKYPLILNGVRFLVNPTSLSIKAGVVVGNLNTEDGVKFQYWYDEPEVLTIKGVAGGTTSYRELLNLKQNFERTDKVSELFYKTRVYYGLIMNLNVSKDAMDPSKFPYELEFKLLFGEKFHPEDFALSASGYLSEVGSEFADFVDAKLSKLEENIDKLLKRII